MSYQDDGDQKPTNSGADNTANQMNEDTEIDLEALNEINDADELRTKLRATVEQKKHWREKHDKLMLDPRLKEQEQKPDQKEKPKPKKSEIDVDALRDEIKDELITRQRHPDLTDEEVERAKKLAVLDGKKIAEVVEDPYFKAYVEGNAKRRAAEGARPAPSNRSGNSSGGSVDDLKDPAKVKEMDDETFSRLSEEAVKQSRSGRLIRH